MFGLTQLLVPIFICVVLPVSIVFIIAHAGTKKEKQKADIIIKAIEANNNVDADKLVESLRTPQKTARQLLNARLLRGCIFGLIGVFICAVGIANAIAGADFSSDAVTAPLVFGGASLAIGLSYIIVFFVTRKQVDNPQE